MTNFYSSHSDRRTRLAVMMTAATLACVALASPAMADAGDRDLEVNAINTAPNLLSPAPMAAPMMKPHAKSVRSTTVAKSHVQAMSYGRHD